MNKNLVAKILNKRMVMWMEFNNWIEIPNMEVGWESCFPKCEKSKRIFVFDFSIFLLMIHISGAAFWTHFCSTALDYAYIPFDDDLDIFEEPDGLLAVSGMCVNNALKKLYSCVRAHRVHYGWIVYDPNKNSSKRGRDREKKGGRKR